MKKILFLLPLCVALFSFAENEKINLTLQEVQRIAVERNPSLAQAKAAVDAAVAGVTQARAAYYPQLNLDAGVTRTRDYYGHSMASAANPKGKMDPYTTYNAGASLNWTIFNGFQSQFQLLTAKYTEQTAKEAEMDARRLLLNAVAQAYYEVLLAQDNMKIAKEDAEFNKVLLEDAKKRHEGGILKQSEVLNFVLRVQNAEVDYVAAEKSWKVSIVALCALLTIDVDGIWDNYTLIYPDHAGELDKDIPQLLDYAHQNRPDLMAVDEKIRIAEEGIRAARCEWLPTLGAFGNYDFQRQDNAHFNKSMDRAINYGLSLSWNVFNGFSTSGRIAQNKANLVSAIKEKEDLLLNIDSEIRQNYYAFQSAKIQLEKQEVVLATARQIRDLVEQEYKGGTATITRLNEVQTDLNNAASARSAAFIQVLDTLETIRAATAENLN